MPEVTAITRAEVNGAEHPATEERRDLVHKAHSMIQPDVYLVHRNGVRRLCKDFSARPWLCRAFVCGPVAQHEYRVLDRLRDLDGVPRVGQSATGDQLEMQFVDGYGPLLDRTEATPEQIPPPAFFAELKQLVRDIHQRGITHSDIRRGNVLRDHRDRPWLIDFATAIDWNGIPGILRRGGLFGVLKQVDYLAVLKLQRHYHPDSLTAEEVALLEALPWYLRTARFLRKRVYRGLIKQKEWRKRFARVRGQPTPSL